MDANQAAPAAPGVKIALLMVLGTIPFIGLLLLAYHLLGISMAYMGFLFLLYWMGIMRQSMADFVPALAGGLGGIALSWLLIGLPAIAGPIALYGAGALLAAIIFFFIRGQFRLLINNAMMLYLTVATIPDLRIAEKAPEMAAALVVAAAYCVMAAQVTNRVMARRQTKPQAPFAAAA